MASNYPKRTIGDDEVSAQGLGCMSLAPMYRYTSLDGSKGEEPLEVLTWAADHGITFWDTSDIYGNSTNEKLLGRWFAETGRRKEIFLATKFGHRRENGQLLLDGTPEYVKKACAASLERLQTDYIDLYYQHRVDPNTPIEKTVEAMVELKKEGKIRYLGLSECSSRSLRRAHKVHPIAAVQMEYSPFALEIESPQVKILQTARELGVNIVAYSPLGRGWLTGAIKSRDDLNASDQRCNHPRFSEATFAGNVRLVEALEAIARAKGCTPGQLSLAWVLAQGRDIIPIPGTKRIKYLEENAAAVHVRLSREDEAKIRKAIKSVGGSRGDRYPPSLMADCFGDSPELE